jgi:hypothetical protein
VKHFIDSLRDQVRIVKRVPKRFSSKYGYSTLEMPPVSWSNEKYYLEQVRFFMNCIREYSQELYIVHNFAYYFQFKVR